MFSKETGNIGEKIAEKYLREKGYEILDRNFIVKFDAGMKNAEIDLVAKKKGVISFVEVKASIVRPGAENSFFPQDRAGFQKQRKIIKAGQIWLSNHKIPLDKPWQVDVVAVLFNKDTQESKIDHFENIASC